MQKFIFLKGSLQKFIFKKMRLQKFIFKKMRLWFLNIPPPRTTLRRQPHRLINLVGELKERSVFLTMAKISYTTELIAALKEREKRQALDTIIGEVAAATLASNKKGTVCLECVLVGKATGFTFEGKSVEISGSCRIYNIALTKAILTVGNGTQNDTSTLLVDAGGNVTVKPAVVQDAPAANANALNI